MTESNLSKSYTTKYISLISLNFRGLVLILVLSLLAFNSFSQEISKSNHEGDWTDNSSWTDNSAPGVTTINSNCIINGKITRTGNLDFNNGDLTVNDTLLIFGNLVLGNNADLTVNSGGILIVFGDYTSGNMVYAVAGGYLIVTGEFEMIGPDNQGSFDINGGKVFILDTIPDIKTGPGYTDLQCPDPDDYPLNCGYGNNEDLPLDPVYSFFTSGSYELLASGPASFCPGGSVILSVPDDGINYQWFDGNNPIPGANSFSYTASGEGAYSLTFLIGSTVLNTDTVTVTLKEVSIAPVSATTDLNKSPV